MSYETMFYMDIGQRALDLMSFGVDADTAWETAKSEYFNAFPIF